SRQGTNFRWDSSGCSRRESQHLYSVTASSPRIHEPVNKAVDVTDAPNATSVSLLQKPVPCCCVALEELQQLRANLQFGAEQRRRLDRHHAEHLGILEAEMSGAEAAHRKAIDCPPLSPGHGSVGGINVRNQLLDQHALDRVLAVLRVAVHGG